MQDTVDPIVTTEPALSPSTACGWPDRNESIVFNNPDVIYADQVLRPLWMFLCTTGNVLNIALLHSIHTYQTVFLVGLAWFDLTCMWAWFSLYIGGFIWRGDALPTFIRVLAAVGNTIAQCSDWTLLAFSFTRVLCTIFPLKARSWFTIGRARIILVVILVLSTATWLFDLVSSVAFPTNLTEHWQIEWLNVHIKGTAVTELVTFFAIFASNIFVIIFLKIQQIQRRNRLGNPTENRPIFRRRQTADREEHGKQPNGHHRTFSIRSHVKKSQTTATVRMLTASTFLYILTKSPVVVYQIMEKMCVARMTDYQYSIFAGVYNQSIFAGYSIQFILYCAVNPPYLKRALHVLLYCEVPPPASSPAGSHLQSTSSGRSLRRNSSHKAPEPAHKAPEPVGI
ncbi:uncharacterized protein LOC129583065 [Paramacrobiotus metropolitanus]|uniref:uncharacterized protein LOC129583065 n=1 Tax=Paramacrobiotus metropolitanus TaxID=2943436 RepID=UPI002445A5DE|nr:uncharacterized protein LOC129583065 [Paramacrobiotus metropolitanus]